MRACYRTFNCKKAQPLKDRAKKKGQRTNFKKLRKKCFAEANPTAEQQVHHIFGDFVQKM